MLNGIYEEYGMELLRKKTEAIGIHLSEEQLNQFKLYYDMLLEKNKVMNLTAITEHDDVINKHFVDSIMLGKLHCLSESLSVIDVGTGAGFPGIPLKIAYPKLRVTLLDSLNKRVIFLKEVIEALQLEGIEAIHSRAEDGARNPQYREKFDLCVSRAVSNLSTLSEYCIPFVKKGGYFISYKSVQIEDEINQAKNAIKILGGAIDRTETMVIPDTDVQRQFVFVQKKASTPKQFPRKAGTAAKTPIE
jgi:16S rRNA (guanine527-N7)-methyltransferase